MIITTLNLTLSILIPFVTGYTFLSYLSKGGPLSIPFKMALAYGLGLGILTLWMFLLTLFHYSLNFLTITIPLLLCSISFLLLTPIKKTNIANPIDTKILKETAPLPLLPKIFIYSFIILLTLYIAHNILYVFWFSMNIPIYTWDATATVAFKAKIFYFEQSIPHLKLLPHPTYPLLTPLAETWVAINLEYWDEQFIKIIFPFAFLSYLIINYTFLKLYTNRIWALLGCAILLSSNLFIHHATISYRDFLLMYYNCTTIILLLLWQRTALNAFLILSAIFAGLTTFVKLEGTAFLGI